jgi:hypothetical protein
VTETSVLAEGVVGLDEFDSGPLRSTVKGNAHQSGWETDTGIRRAGFVAVDTMLKPVTGFGKRLRGGCVARDVDCWLDGQVERRMARQDKGLDHERYLGFP